MVSSKEKCLQSQWHNHLINNPKSSPVLPLTKESFKPSIADKPFIAALLGVGSGCLAAGWKTKLGGKFLLHVLLSHLAHLPSQAFRRHVLFYRQPCRLWHEKKRVWACICPTTRGSLSCCCFDAIETPILSTGLPNVTSKV